MCDEEMEITETINSDKEMEEENNSKVYLPGLPVEEGEELICDPTAYIMYHQAQTSAPCLSFDIIRDSLGDNRETFPLTTYLVAGTQAAQSHINNIIVMKLSNLHKTGKDDEEDSSDEDEEDLKSPKMTGALVKHQGCVNRIRVIYI